MSSFWKSAEHKESLKSKAIKGGSGGGGSKNSGGAVPEHESQSIVFFISDFPVSVLYKINLTS